MTYDINQLTAKSSSLTLRRIADVFYYDDVDVNGLSAEKAQDLLGLIGELVSEHEDALEETQDAEKELDELKEKVEDLKEELGESRKMKEEVDNLKAELVRLQEMADKSYDEGYEAGYQQASE